MSLSYTTRRRLSLLVLTLGLPAYIAAALILTGWLYTHFGRLPLWAEFAVFVVLGVIWIVPLKPIFLGVGQPDPDAKIPPQDPDT